MTLRRINWPLWLGLLLSLFAFLSYYLIFVWYPTTRDFPWANLVLIVGALALLIAGFRRAFKSDRPRRSKIIASIVTSVGVLVCVFFLFIFFIAAKWIPAAPGAPRVGQKAPGFTITDTNDKPISLAQLLSTPIEGKSPKGVVLIFYRGYW